ncbi:MAG: dihydrofolate reductase family protein [Lachnospiraceae bacterium]|nr:dihydrofolate reductase family protein [Lachnospiraceae bacterium]
MKISLVSEVSIDGKITFGEGKSSKDLFSLLSQEDMEFIHQIRGRVEGILVGMNTIRYDNPSLTCRYVEGANPIRIIPTRSLELPEDATVLNDGIPTILITTESNREKADSYRSYDNVRFVFAGENKIDFANAFAQLEIQYDIHTIMLEGGGTLNWTLIDKNMISEIIIIRLPIIIGGKDNVSLVDGEGYSECSLAKKYCLKSVELRGNVTINNYVKA